MVFLSKCVMLGAAWGLVYQIGMLLLKWGLTVTLFVKANPQLQNSVFEHSLHHEQSSFASDEQEPSCCIHRNLHQWKRHSATDATAEIHHPPPHCAHVHSLVSINVQQLLMSAIFFSAWRNLVMHLCFRCTSMSDNVWSDFSSVAIRHIAVTHSGILVGRFSPYCHTTTICLWRCGPTQ